MLFRSGNVYVSDVQADVVDGVDALKSFSRGRNAGATLRVVKSKVRNDFLASLNSTGAIAERFAWYYRFNRDPHVLDTLMQAIDQLQPKDIDGYAQKYFSPEGRIVTTLWQGAQKPSAAPEAR